MQLDEVVPWGRSYEEYSKMFSLPSTFTGSILSVADGPSSFNAEGSALGLDITSCDPVYQYSATALAQRIDQVYPTVMAQVEQHQDQFIWTSIRSPAALAEKRMASMQRFLADFDEKPEHYITASLPDLPFNPQQFDLALCSHFLFLYSEQFDESFHITAIKTLCRVAKEVRIYPLVTLENARSPHLKSVKQWLRSNGYQAKEVEVDYAFQKGATHMLRIIHHD
jgi:hypothetical protein